jgi:hypothetical protein
MLIVLMVKKNNFENLSFQHFIWYPPGWKCYLIVFVKMDTRKSFCDTRATPIVIGDQKLILVVNPTVIENFRLPSLQRSKCFGCRMISDWNFFVAIFSVCHCGLAI